jgi:penicillin-binding protein 1A
MNGKLRSVFKILGWCAAFVAVLLLVGIIASLLLYQRYAARAAKYDLTKIDAVPERSSIYDANGEHYGFFGGENRLVVPLSAVSKNFLNALLAREDARFWKHEGVDWRGVLRAVIANARAGETKQGASTITQQLARNACDLRAKTLDRKGLEAALAFRIERKYSKEQILELYVNRIYFGSSYHGIEAAARGYFGKSAADLTLAEGATLAALIRNPKRLSPRNESEDAWAARNVVLDRMRELRWISEEEALAAKAQQINIAQSNSMRATDDDVTDAVLQELELLLSTESIQLGGLKVFMTIDPALQRLAQAAADRRLTEIEEAKDFSHPKKREFIPSPKEASIEKPTNYLQAAVVAIDNRTGAIRAAVGGRDYSHSKYSRALQAKRQIGSTFKPFVYAAAFERGLLPGSLIDDAEIRAGEFRDLPKNWSPQNSDDEYGGPTPAAIGLLKSRNTMSVRVGEVAGLSKVRELAQSVGIADEIPNLPVVFLGGFEATVRDVAAGYTVFPNLGVYRRPFLISSVEDRDGHVLWRAPAAEKRVISPDTAWMTSSILQEVMKTGTASKSKSLGWKKVGAGKTGTTNEVHDAWFVGYTSSLTCAVWVGLDQPQTITSKGYGSTLALPVWVDFMQQVQEKEYPSAPFEPPAPAVKATLCSISGLKATSVCGAKGCAYETELPASRMPGAACTTHPEPAPQPVVAAPVMLDPNVAQARAQVANPVPPAARPADVAAVSAAPTPAQNLTPNPIPPPIYEYDPSAENNAGPAAPNPGVAAAPAGRTRSERIRSQQPAAVVTLDPGMPSTPAPHPRKVQRSQRPIAVEPIPPMESPSVDPRTTRRTVEIRRAVPIEKPSSDMPPTPDPEAKPKVVRRTTVKPSSQDALPPAQLEAPPSVPERTVKRRGLFNGDDDDDKDDKDDDDD